MTRFPSLRISTFKRARNWTKSSRKAPCSCDRSSLRSTAAEVTSFARFPFGFFCGSKLPSLECLDRLLQRGALIGMLRGREQFFVGVDGEIDSLVVVLGSGEPGRVVRRLA